MENFEESLKNSVLMVEALMRSEDASENEKRELLGAYQSLRRVANNHGIKL